jgi:hypothetical protein
MILNRQERYEREASFFIPSSRNLSDLWALRGKKKHGEINDT